MRRSFLARKLAGALSTPRSLALFDLSLLPRAGFKGRGAPEWLAANGLTLPAAPNLAMRQPDGLLVARLSAEEHLLLAPLSGEPGAIERLDAAWSLDGAPGCYRLPRSDSHAWLLLAGASADRAMAKLCGVDLRPHRFANLAVAQTSVARISAVVARDDLGQRTAYHVLCDSASAEYLWDCLTDAIAEFDGCPASLDGLRQLGRE